MPAYPLPPAATAVLDFWFGTSTNDTATAKMQRKLWWSKDAAVDSGIRARFASLVNAAAAGDHDGWAGTPRGRLALILLFDQFPRNIHRNTPQAFAHDARALHLALDGIATGADLALRPIERVFCYLPLEHAESAEIQERSVALFTALATGMAEADRGTFAGYADYAVRHRDVIHRFGRFPHRNRILGRAPTTEEEQFLREPGSSF